MRRFCFWRVVSDIAIALSNDTTRSVCRASGFVVCWACSAAWGCKSPAQPDGHAALLLEIGRELQFGVQAIANLPVVFGPSEALRRNRAHQVHPTCSHPLCRQEAAEDSARGKGIPGQVDDPVVERLPGIVCRLDVHVPVIDAEVEW